MLSVCCRTAAPAGRIEALVEPLRGLLGELVVGCPPGSAARYAEVADRAVELGPEQDSALLRAAAGGDWSLELSDLELPSAALAGDLPALLADPAVDAWALPRRWAHPDPEHWLDELGWWPDFGVRLRRRGIEAPGPDRVALARAPLYHLDCVLNRREDRAAEAIVLNARSPGMRVAGGGALTDLFEPERAARRAPARTPEPDAAAIRAVLAAEGRPAPAGAPPAPAPAAPPASAPAPLESDLRFAPGETRPVAFAAAGGVRAVRVEITAPDAEGPAAVGFRVPLPGAEPVPVELAIEVRPPPPLPDRREVRPGAPPRGLARLRRRRHSAIPRIKHRVWLGERPLPAEDAALEASWLRLHPDWESRLWTDADAPAPPGVERARSHAERADLVRYEILRRHGGIYSDTDVEWLRPIDPLLAGVEAFAAYEVPGRICNAVIGAVPGHPVFERAVALAERTVGTGVYPSATATDFLTGIVERDPRVTLFGPERFYPYLWDEERRPREHFPDAYAVHRWAMSWRPDSER